MAPNEPQVTSPASAVSTATSANELTPARMKGAAAAAYCGLTAKALSNMRFRGIGPRYHRSGPFRNSTVFYLVADLDKWIKDQSTMTAASDGSSTPGALSPEAAPPAVEPSALPGLPR